MASVQKEAPPLTHVENEAFLRMIRDARQRLGNEVPEKVEIVFDNVSAEAKMPFSGRALPTLPNAIVNGGKVMLSFWQ
ncbi:hypothetical protein PVAP13_2NG252500 [Panicum virgatum]|uniref:Uncharacterized protein n=1 Tax=Panicum virgatum TaxID=38727 RepID=A0A8T0VRE7_PANVG|nr:hypothetical protein PVAP13_2NG252500 [Panicum virgatum]